MAIYANENGTIKNLTDYQEKGSSGIVSIITAGTRTFNVSSNTENLKIFTCKFDRDSSVADSFTTNVSTYSSLATLAGSSGGPIYFYKSWQQTTPSVNRYFTLKFNSNGTLTLDTSSSVPSGFLMLYYSLY